MQEKQEKRGKEPKTVVVPKLKTASASQVINKKDSKLEAKGNNRAQDIRIENFDIAYGDRSVDFGLLNLPCKRRNF